MNSLKNVWIPVTSFLLAVLIAVLAGPQHRAFARKFADATGVEGCVNYLRGHRARARARNLHIDAVHPAQSTGKLRTRSVVNLTAGAVSGGQPVKTDNIVQFASELQLHLSGTHADGSYASEVLVLSLTPIDGFGREEFEHVGIKRKNNIEAQFHESADDLARLLRNVIRVRSREGDTMTFDSNTQLYAFKQVIASATHLDPIENNEVPCATSTLPCNLVLQTTGGWGSTEGFQD